MARYTTTFSVDFANESNLRKAIEIAMNTPGYNYFFDGIYSSKSDIWRKSNKNGWTYEGYFEEGYGIDESRLENLITLLKKISIDIDVKAESRSNYVGKYRRWMISKRGTLEIMTESFEVNDEEED